MIVTKIISNLKIPKYFYEVVFDKPGGLVMPIIVEYEFEDGSAKIELSILFRFGEKTITEVSKIVTSNKKIVTGVSLRS